MNKPPKKDYKDNNRGWFYLNERAEGRGLRLKAEGEAPLCGRHLPGNDSCTRLLLRFAHRNDKAGASKYHAKYF